MSLYTEIEARTEEKDFAAIHARVTVLLDNPAELVPHDTYNMYWP